MATFNKGISGDNTGKISIMMSSNRKSKMVLKSLSIKSNPTGIPTMNAFSEYGIFLKGMNVKRYFLQLSKMPSHISFC